MKKEFSQPGRIKNFSAYNSNYEELLLTLSSSSRKKPFLILKNKLYSLMISLAAFYMNLNSNIVWRFA